MHHVLDLFSPATRAWFSETFQAPTPAQEQAWQAIASGENTLVIAPTGSGKTLAAFMWAIDQLAAPPDAPLGKVGAFSPRIQSPSGKTEDTQTPSNKSASGATGPRKNVPNLPGNGTSVRVLYISPLKALAADIERNLSRPLEGIARISQSIDGHAPDITTAVRTGDTPASERQRLARKPPDILITTPESLFLLLTSNAGESLRSVTTVIVDEVHAVASTKRGSHLALSLERLDALLASPAQRIGLSATVRPADQVAKFLGKNTTVVAPPSNKEWELRVTIPVPDLTELGTDVADSNTDSAALTSIWPHVEEGVVDLIEQHNSTIVFVNSRILAERLTTRINEIHARRRGYPEPAPSGPPAQVMAQSAASKGMSDLGAPLLAKAHHGSVSKEQRAVVEDGLKNGRLAAVVATSSLELGIDMGAVDLVIHVESPPSVSSGLQRVGRAGHQVGTASRGVFFPKHRGDLLQTAVVTNRMRSGQIEEISIPRNPLDVLAQHIVAATAMDTWDADEMFTLVKNSYPFATLPSSSYHAVLDMLSGRYPSDEFAELRPRIVWDRENNRIRGRPGNKRLATTSGGTIPDRGLYGVFLVGSDPRRGGARVGELDEVMVYESRVGDVFALGATSWRIEEITHDRVLVSPAPGLPGRLPFWIGDMVGRPAELGAALGSFTHELASSSPTEARRRAINYGLDDWAADNLVAYLSDQRDATGLVPDHRTIVVERFRDELGDWRLIVHSPYGSRVHAPWALALRARFHERYGVDAQVAHGDDGMVVRIPDTNDSERDSDIDLVVLDPEDITDLVTTELTQSPLFAARFRECAARALLLPRRDPGKRSPLWQQRQRSAQLLDVAAKYGSFPMLLETMRECLHDVYDLPALRDLMSRIASQEVRVTEVTTTQPSPFARSLLLDYVAVFMYEGDSPLAEQRAGALALDSALLSDLLGETSLRELLSGEVIEQLEAELQRKTPQRQARSVEGVADLLRTLGSLTLDAIIERCAPGEPVAEHVESLIAQRRVIQVTIAGTEHFASIEDAGRLRDALGVKLPPDIHTAYTTEVPDPLGDLISRYARTHGPFQTVDVAEHFGLGSALVTPILRRLAGDKRLATGELRPTSSGMDWCDPEVLRTIRRRSLAALRQEAEPVSQTTLARFLPAWHSVSGNLRGLDGVVRVIEQLGGTPVTASALETLILPSRIGDYRPEWLDELTTTGEVIWAGHARLPGSDAWVSLHLADTAQFTLPEPNKDDTLLDSPIHTSILTTLSSGGGYFFRAIVDAVDSEDARESVVLEALWDLVFAGMITNDSLAGLRARLSQPRVRPPRAHHHRPGRPRIRVSPRSPATTSGRWSLLPPVEGDPTRRFHAIARSLLDRHGIVTRAAVMSERIPGGFAAAYRVLSAFEESGKARRGYFVEGLGAAQFATENAINRLRTHSHTTQALVLAASDPANPYGAALAWPPTADNVTHRPGRKAGAIVVLVDGALALYLERGGKTVVAWSDEPDVLRSAAAALAQNVQAKQIDSIHVERVNNTSVHESPLAAALESVGFHRTPRGLRLRQ